MYPQEKRNRSNFISLAFKLGNTTPPDNTPGCFCYLVALSCLTLLQPHGLSPTRLLCPSNSPAKNTGVGCHFLFQGIFLTQGSNLSLLHLLHWQAGSLPLAPLGKPPISPFLPILTIICNHLQQPPRTCVLPVFVNVNVIQVNTLAFPSPERTFWHLELLLLLSHFSCVRLSATP